MFFTTIMIVEGENMGSSVKLCIKEPMENRVIVETNFIYTLDELI
jgi:hypothetical protein